MGGGGQQPHEFLNAVWIRFLVKRFHPGDLLQLYIATCISSFSTLKSRRMYHPKDKFDAVRWNPYSINFPYLL